MNIILAVDGSEHSLAAMEMVHDLNLPPNSRVTAIGVFLPRDAASYGRHEINVHQAKAVLEDKNVDVQTEVIAGNPAEVLTHCGEQQHCSLIVLGAKGLRATLGILLGGVAQQVVEYAQWPVLVVRAPYHGIRKVLLVTDGSTYSEQAQQFLGCFPLPDQTAVEAMYVLPPPPIPQAAIIAQAWPIAYERGLAIEVQSEKEVEAMLLEEEEQGKKLLSETVQNLEGLFSAHGNPRTVKSVLVRGDAASEIIAYAKAEEIDLIVAGSRGLSQVQSWLLGSVSRKLVHYSSCSVCIVRGMPQPDKT